MMMDTMISDDTVRMDCIYIDMITCVRRIPVGISEDAIVIADVNVTIRKDIKLSI